MKISYTYRSALSGGNYQSIDHTLQDTSVYSNGISDVFQSLINNMLKKPQINSQQLLIYNKFAINNPYDSIASQNNRNELMWIHTPYLSFDSSTHTLQANLPAYINRRTWDNFIGLLTDSGYWTLDRLLDYTLISLMKYHDESNNLILPLDTNVISDITGLVVDAIHRYNVSNIQSGEHTHD